MRLLLFNPRRPGRGGEGGLQGRFAGEIPARVHGEFVQAARAEAADPRPQTSDASGQARCVRLTAGPLLSAPAGWNGPHAVRVLLGRIEV